MEQIKKRLFRVDDVIRVREKIAPGSENSLEYYRLRLPDLIRVDKIDECCASPSLHLVHVDGSAIKDEYIQSEQGCIPESYFILVEGGR